MECKPESKHAEKCLKILAVKCEWQDFRAKIENTELSLDGITR